jgi:hypothetical protein
MEPPRPVVKRPHNTHIKPMAGMNQERLDVALSLPVDERSNGENQLVLVYFSLLRKRHGVNAVLRPPRVPPVLWPHIVEWEKNPSGTPFWVRVNDEKPHPFFDTSDSNIALMFKLLAAPDPKVFPAKPHPPRKLVLTQFRNRTFANNGAEYWKVLDLLDLHPTTHDGRVRWYAVQVIQDGYPYCLEADAECYVCFILWLYQAGINSLTWARIVAQTIARESAREARCNYPNLPLPTIRPTDPLEMNDLDSYARLIALCRENGPGGTGTYTGPLCAPLTDSFGEKAMEVSPISPIASPRHVPSYATVAADSPPPVERMEEDIVPLASRISLDVPGENTQAGSSRTPLASRISLDVRGSLSTSSGSSRTIPLTSRISEDVHMPPVASSSSSRPLATCVTLDHGSPQPGPSSKKILRNYSSMDSFDDDDDEERDKLDPPGLPLFEDFERGNTYLVCKGLCVIDVVKELSLGDRIPADGYRYVAFDGWDPKEGWKWQKWPSTLARERQGWISRTIIPMEVFATYTLTAKSPAIAGYYLIAIVFLFEPLIKLVDR